MWFFTDLIVKRVYCSISNCNYTSILNASTVKVHPCFFKVALTKKDLKKISFVFKIERVILKQIEEYLATNKLMDVLQSAYRAMHSTSLLKVQNAVLSAFDQEGFVVVLVLLDLSVIFDTIDHTFML